MHLNLNPFARKLKLDTRNPRPSNLHLPNQKSNPALYTLKHVPKNLIPETKTQKQNPILCTRNPNPYTLNPRPSILVPRTQTLKQDPIFSLVSAILGALSMVNPDPEPRIPNPDRLFVCGVVLLTVGPLKRPNREHS